MDSSQPDLIAGRYQVRERLGRGGMGVVYLAYDQELPRLVAVKLLRNNDPDLYERFAREARLAASLDHPNVVTIFDRGIHEGQPFIVMQYVAGETLEELIKRRAPMPLARKLRLMAALCDGLASAHSAGVVHRDVKPANIKIARDGTLKILDFGIARQVESGMTQVGSVIGTLSYMSPEQVEGDHVDHRSDQFSVGLVCYELLVFEKAFQGDERVVPALIQTTEPRPLQGFGADLPADLIRVVNRAMRKSPAERYPDLVVMQQELLRIAEPLDGAVPHHVPRNEELETFKVKKGSSRGSRSDHGRFAERRRAQIESLLERAGQALARGDFDDVLVIGEQAAILDPDDQRILDLLALATKGLEDRQVREWLDQAKRQIAAGDLTAASDFVARSLELRPRDKTALTLQRSVSQLQEERERASQRARAVQQALAHTRRALEEGAFESAIRSASEALAVDPANADASALGQQARAALDARHRYEEDVRQQRENAARRRQEEEKKRRLEQEQRLVIEEAARRQAETEAERRRLEEARGRLAEAEAEARRRGAAEAEEHKRRQIDDVAARVAAALLAEDLSAAEAALDELRTLDADEQLFRQLRFKVHSHQSALLERQRRGEHDRLATAAVEASRLEFEGGRTAEALRRLEAFSPPHPAVTAALDGLRKIADAEGKQRQARLAAEEARRRRLVAEKLAEAGAHLARGAFAEALASVSATLALAPDAPGAAELRDDILRSQSEATLKDRAQRTVDEANGLAAIGEFHEAIQRLEDFSPPHALVSRTLDTIKVLAAQFERRASEAIAESQQLFESGNEAEAIASLDAFTPPHPGVSEAARALSARLRAAEQASAAQRRQAEDLGRQGQLKDAIALLDNISTPPPSVRTALQSLREQYTLQLQQRAATEREQGENYGKAVGKVRTALSGGNVVEGERLLKALRVDFPDAAELELLAEELARQRPPRPGPVVEPPQQRLSGSIWIAASAASALLVAGAVVAYRMMAPASPPIQRAETTRSSVETTTSIPFPPPEAPANGRTPPPEPPPGPKPSPPPPGPEVTRRAADLIEAGNRPGALQAIESGLRDERTQNAFAGFVDAYLGRVQADVRARADRARQGEATWAPSFRNAEAEARLAQETSRSNRTESLQHFWNAADLYERSLTEQAQARQIVERAEGLFKADNREGALEELVRPGTDHLQSPDAVVLLRGMRGQAEERVQGARTRAVSSGASDEAAFREASAAHANAGSLLREGRLPEGVRRLWEAERLFVASILPAKPVAPSRPEVEVLRPTGVADQVLREVLDRFKQAYDSGQPARLEQAFPQLKDEVKDYRAQLGACKQVTIEFSRFKVVGKDPSGTSAQVETETVYNCVQATARGRRRSETAVDQFSLAPGPGGTWTITRKWK